MNSIRNSITLIGHLGQDPELKTTVNGNKLASISLATNDTYRNNKGDKITTTEWHRCVAWGKLAEIVESLGAKGKEVAIRGKLTYQQYEDKEGIRRNMPQIVISDFVMLGAKS
jgi:single-strand DNA-binding protein